MVSRIFGDSAYVFRDYPSTIIEIYRFCILDLIGDWSPDEAI